VTTQSGFLVLGQVVVPPASANPSTINDVRVRAWDCSPPPQQVRFTASGTFDKIDYFGAKRVRIICIGPGGAGGGCPATSAVGAGTSSYGSGGGAGGWSETWMDFDDIIEDSVAVHIGAGGVGADDTDGTDGDVLGTSFGTYCKSNPGSGGKKSTATDTSGVGDGGPGAIVTGAIGDTKMRGGSGGMGIRVGPISALGGSGGLSALSGGGSASLGAGNGNDANSNSGAGGGGAVSENGAAAHKGGDGGSGLCLVEVYW
jgi:hypothetical protein